MPPCSPLVVGPGSTTRGPPSSSSCCWSWAKFPRPGWGCPKAYPPALLSFISAALGCVLEVYRPKSPDPGEKRAFRPRAGLSSGPQELGDERGAILRWVKTGACSGACCVVSTWTRNPVGTPVDEWSATVGGRSAECAPRATRLPGSMQSSCVVQAAVPRVSSDEPQKTVSAAFISCIQHFHVSLSRLLDI